MAVCWPLIVLRRRAPSTWLPTATVKKREVVPGTVESVPTTTWSIDFSISDVPQKGASYLKATAGGNGMVLNLEQPSKPAMTSTAKPEHRATSTLQLLALAGAKWWSVLPCSMLM